MEEAGVKVQPYITGYLSKGDPKKPRDRMSYLPSLGRHAVRTSEKLSPGLSLELSRGPRSC